jgi:molecular chaperone GrpE
MTDSTFSQEFAGEPSPNGNARSREEVPQFGAVDIVEAFTAMRHEWRGQTKESRTLAEQIQAAVTSIQSLESKLLASVADRRSDDASEARPLALLIVETDHQLSRAVTAIAQWETNRRLREAADAKVVEQCAAAMNRVARWFARPLLASLAAQRSAQGPIDQHPALEGLNMVLARLRRMMREHGIERLDVQGQPFDANTMCAIGAIASTDCPSGHVAGQLSPAYHWQGKLLRFADVRVAS